MHRATKVQILGVIGAAIALYACSVEAHMDEDDYEALCDISASFSCTEVFKSEYGHILSHMGIVPKPVEGVHHPLDLSLAVIGLVLYSAYFLAACLWSVIPFRKPLFLTVATAGACFSCYLLYVLKFILQDFCIVCTGFHCVNFCSASPRPEPGCRNR
jgi:vitamin-K-epoxide reductase (warfarin-sensitive)